MVNIITTRDDLKKKEVREAILYQIEQVCKKAQPDYGTYQIRIVIGAELIKKR